jgi:ribosomal protein S18 acetylase RimI-like enzyme
VTLTEWGSLSADALTPLYKREETHWRAALGWDTTASWATVESARVSWGLPGLVCSDPSGAICGWTFFLRRDGMAEVGGLVADSGPVTAALLDGLLTHAGSSLGGFIYATAPGLGEACAARGIAVERYSYLTRATHRVPCARSSAFIRAWRPYDGDQTASLLREAYGRCGRLFAPNNSEREWRSYVHNLIAYSGCGVLRPDLSRVVESHGGLVGLALVTALASDTAHLVQLAVRPEVRRAGIGSALIVESLKSAHASGYRQMSLLVSNENTSACELYRRLGFVERGEFLALRSH